jgi:heme exporter protein C
MISYLANPARFARVSKWLKPILALLAIVFVAAGTFKGLVTSPEADLHGQGVRMLYVHVPSAYVALGAYTLLTIASFISFVWRHPLADMGAKSLAVPGLVFTILCLATGSLWGKPAWGTWWQWDARMTSVLVLAFIYAGYILLWQVIEDKKRAARLCSIVAMVGFVNIPIIKFSVDWWNTLHQPASISSPGAPGMDGDFFIPLLVMTIGYFAVLGWTTICAIEGELVALRNKRQTKAKPATITVSED